MSTAYGYWNGWPAEKKHKEHQQALHCVSARSLAFCSSPFFLSLLFSCNTTECYSASVFLSLHESLHLSPSLSLHPWLHSIHPWEPIDRLQQPFNEISPALLEKRNVVQSNDNSLPLFLLIAPSLTFYIYNLSRSLFCAWRGGGMIGRQYR